MSSLNGYFSLVKLTTLITELEKREDRRSIYKIDGKDTGYYVVSEVGDDEYEVCDGGEETRVLPKSALEEMSFDCFGFSEISLAFPGFNLNEFLVSEDPELSKVVVICPKIAKVVPLVTALEDYHNGEDANIWLSCSHFSTADTTDIQGIVQRAFLGVQKSLVFLDSWQKPSLLIDSLCLYLTHFLIDMNKDSIQLLYDKTSSPIENLYSSEYTASLTIQERVFQFDMSRTYFIDELFKKAFLALLLKLPRGLSSLSEEISGVVIDRAIGQIKQSEDMDSKRDHIQMEKYAINCYEMGDFFTSVSQYGEADKILRESIRNYTELQKYKNSRPNVKNEILPELEQAEFDRVNGGMCIAHSLLAKVNIAMGNFEKAEIILKVAEEESLKVRSQFHMCFLKLALTKTFISEKRNERVIETKGLRTLSLLLKDSKQRKRQIIRAKVELRLAHLLLRTRDVDRKEVLASIEQAELDFSEFLPDYCSHLVETLVLKAHLQFADEDYEAALKIFLQAKELLEEHIGTKNHYLSKILTHIGQTYSLLGETFFEEARNSYQSSIELFELFQGKTCDVVTLPLNYLGNLLKDKEPEQAVKALTRAHEILAQNTDSWAELDKTAQKKLKSRHAAILSNLGQVLIAVSELERATEALELCCAITEEVLGADNPTTKRRRERLEELK